MAPLTRGWLAGLPWGRRRCADHGGGLLIRRSIARPWGVRSGPVIRRSSSRTMLCSVMRSTGMRPRTMLSPALATMLAAAAVMPTVTPANAIALFEPEPTPPPVSPQIGGRVMVDWAGLAMTFPDEWTVQVRRAPAVSSAGASVLVAFGPQETSCLLDRYDPNTFEIMAGRRGRAGRGTDPRWAGGGALRRPAGYRSAEVVRVHDPRAGLPILAAVQLVRSA